MRWKWIVGVGVIGVIAFIAAVYSVLATYDYNKLKPEVARMVKDATGRDLRLAGDMTLVFGWSPVLEVNDVTLANVPWGSQPEMAKIEKLRLQARLLPLLLKKVELERIGLAGAEVLLETDAKGRRNWDLSLKDPPEKKAAASGPFKLDIDHILIENFALVVRKAEAESVTRINITRLDLARQASGDTQTVDLQSEFNGHPVEITGTTASIHELLVQPRFPLNLSAKIATTELTIDGVIEDIINFAGIDLVFDGSGRNLAEIGSLIGEKLPATDQFALKGRLKGSAQALSLKEARGSASRGSLRLTLNGAVQDFYTLGGMDLASVLSGQDLTEFGDVIGVKLPATDEFEIEGQLTGSTDVLALQAAKASAGRGSMRLSLKGAVKDLLTLTGLDLQSRLSGSEMAELWPLVGSDLPPTGPFEVSGQLTGSTKDLAMEPFSATIGRSDFKGRVQVAFQTRPKVTLRLESELVDHTDLLEDLEEGQSTPEATRERPERFFSDTPLSLGGFQKVDADIELKARQIQARRALLDQAHLSVKLKDGDFSIDKFEATYKKTKIVGDLHIHHGTPPRVATNFMVQNFDIGSFSKEIGVSDKVRGHVDMAANLKSQGDSPHSLAASLDGTIGAVMGEGYLTHYLDMLSVNLSQKVLDRWGEEDLDQADQINCAVVQFDIDRGIATSRAFVFDSKALVLTGEGNINLGTEQVQFVLNPNPKKPGILEIPINLRVSGTIMEPIVRADKLALITEAGAMLGSLPSNSLGVLRPFAQSGAEANHPCDIKSIGQ